MLVHKGQLILLINWGTIIVSEAIVCTFAFYLFCRTRKMCREVFSIQGNELNNNHFEDYVGDIYCVFI